MTQKGAFEKIVQEVQYNRLKITISKKHFMKIQLTQGMIQANKKLNKELQVEKEPS